MQKKDIFMLTLFSIISICQSISYEDIVHDRNQFVEQEILVLRAGGQNLIDGSSVGRKILLKNLFPDWLERVAYQREQERFYKSALAKIQESKRLRILDKSSVKLLTFEEKDAFNYFNGIGFYKKYQNPKTLPNIFDTRQTLLLKMENLEMQRDFLNSYNNRFKQDY